MVDLTMYMFLCGGQSENLLREVLDTLVDTVASGAVFFSESEIKPADIILLLARVKEYRKRNLLVFGIDDCHGCNGGVAKPQ